MPDKRDNPYLTDTLTDRAVVFRPDEGVVLRAKGATVTLKVTSDLSNDQLGIYEIELAPGVVGAKLHYHRFMDETFIVTRGVLRAQHGSQSIDAEEGSVIYLPRFTPHGFANISAKPVRLTLVFNPAARREGFFRGLVSILSADPVNAQDFLARYQKYDSYPV